MRNKITHIKTNEAGNSYLVKKENKPVAVIIEIYVSETPCIVIHVDNSLKDKSFYTLTQALVYAEKL